jgi:peroxiredoxin
MRSLVLAVLLATAVARADAPRPWIGVLLAPGTTGVKITSVLEGTPGQRAGLHVDDEVLAIDGTAVKVPRELIEVVAHKGIGTKIAVDVVRDGKRMAISLALAVRPEAVDLVKKQLVDRRAPDFALADAVGTTPASLGKLAGHVVVLEFWATWCGYCRDSRPKVSTWQTTYGERGVRVLGISGDDLDDLRKVAADEKLAFTIARDPDDAVARRYFVPALPTFVVIDKAGIVRYVGVGEGDGIAGVEPAIQALLK